MSDEGLLHLRIAVQEDDADVERLDRLARSLAQQLRNFDAVTLEQEAEQTKAGSKGDAVTIGAVVLGVAVAAIPNLIAFLQQWAVGSRKVTVEVNGIKVEFTPNHRYSKEEIVELVRSLNRIKQQ